MTNAEAIETLRANYPDACFEQLRCAVDMAINALTKEAWKEKHPVSPLLQKLATNLQSSKQLSNDSPELDKENGELIRRKEAINTVHRMREIWDTGDIDDLEEMIVTALAELCPEKRTETHACDCIERQAAIDALEKSRFPGAPYIDRGILIALKEIKKLPSAQPQPQRTGHWISVFDEDEDKCSECQATFFCASTRFNFCPHCGAKMEDYNEAD